MERCRNVGFHCAADLPIVVHPRFRRAHGRFALQRLYSTFPGGRPGIGLLLLRVAAGLFAVAGGGFFLSGLFHSFSEKSCLGLLLLAGGIALVAGFLTPVAGLLLGLCFLGMALSWFPAPAWAFHDVKLFAVAMIITVTALALLGPGAFSLDGRLFGRREIVIPPSSRAPEE